MSKRSNAGASTVPPSTIPGGVGETTKNNKWVTVAWMPHASLSNTSNIKFMVRSVVTRLDELKHHNPEEWQVRVSLQGLGGLPLDGGIYSLTKKSPLESVRRKRIQDANRTDNTDLATAVVEEEGEVCGDEHWPPMVSDMTHYCQFDSIIQLPLRWRDLPRDAVYSFEVLGLLGQVVSFERNKK